MSIIHGFDWPANTVHTEVIIFNCIYRYVIAEIRLLNFYRGEIPLWRTLSIMHGFDGTANTKHKTIQYGHSRIK